MLAIQGSVSDVTAAFGMLAVVFVAMALHLAISQLPSRKLAAIRAARRNRA